MTQQNERSEAARIMAKWWGSFLRQASRFDPTIVKGATKEATLEKFEDELTKIIVEAMDSGQAFFEVRTDYEPDLSLQKAAEAAGFQLGMTALPWKQHSRINKDNSLRFSH